jgi:glycosyltransferase involved in cell wall biosynthesis
MPTDKPKVLHVIARYNVGGTARYLNNLFPQLSADVDALLAVGHVQGHEIEDSSLEKINFVRIENLGRRISPKADLRAYFELRKLVKHYKPQIIHSHTFKAGVLSRLMFFKTPKVHTFHGHLLHGYFGAGKTKLVILVEKFLALFTDQLLAVGMKVQNDLINAGIGNESNFAVMPPGLQLAKVPSKTEARLELRLDPDKIYCAFIGRITQIKRPDRFLDVVSTIKVAGTNVHFVVAGAGEQLDYCQKRASDENLPVTFLGWREDIELVLAAADFVILTSDNEGTPLSLIQAGMVGIPVVATSVGSTNEIVVNGETGFLTDLSVDQLANAVTKLAKDSNLRAKMGYAGQEYTLARYGVARLVKDHQDLYMRLLNRK